MEGRTLHRSRSYQSASVAAEMDTDNNSEPSRSYIAGIVPLGEIKLVYRVISEQMSIGRCAEKHARFSLLRAGYDQ